jgi:glycosyltransferase involved in cell wall biosynthesis
MTRICTRESETDFAIDVARPPATSIAQAGSPRIAVVIPSYKVSRNVLDVIRRIGADCGAIYVIDDACPEHSGDIVEANCDDRRVRVIRNASNQGVGGAVMAGYRAALEDGIDIVVKVDGDGQMAPELLPRFVVPILAGNADYAKGNRFYDLTNIARMPSVRIVGNAILSFSAKLSTGYWDIFDPNNGYTAIHARVLQRLPLEKISRRYFFETDMLFRLNTVRAVVVDVPMDAVYGDEVSNLKIRVVLGEFMWKHMRNFGKRIFYNYFLRDVSLASLELLVGSLLLAFGVGFGVYHWVHSAMQGLTTATGTIMLAAVSVLSGLQFVLSFINYDIASVPRRPIHPLLGPG